MRSTTCLLLTLGLGCASGTDPGPAPPPAQYPLARTDPAAQLPAEFQGLPEEVVTDDTHTQVDSAVASQGVRYMLDSETEVPLGPALVPDLGMTLAMPGGEAGPLFQPEVGSSQQPIVFGSDNRRLVPDSLGWPARALVKLAISWRNGAGGGCSGTLIGRKYVLTAGHCVHNPDKGGWAASVQVIPGLDGSYMPFGSARSVTFDSVTGWTQDRNNDYDFAMITLDRNLGDATGWLGLASLSDSTMDGLNSAVQGYPGDLSGGTRQYVASGAIQDFDSTMIYYFIDSMPGDSGAVLKGVSSYADYTFGVHTGTSLFWLTQYNRATRINNSRYYQIQGWMTSRAGLGTVGGDFTGWSNLGGAVYTNPTAVTSGSGRVDLFVRGTDGAVYHKYRTSTTWSPSTTGWNHIGGGITDTVAAVSRSANQLDLFVRGNGGGLWTKALNGATWWPAGTGWASLGGDIAGAPVAVSYGASRLDVFARDTAGSVLWWSWSGGAWSGPMSLGGPKTTHSPAAVVGGPNRIDVVVRDVNGRYQHRGYNGSSWSAWTDLGDWFGGPPTIVAPSAGVLDVFGRDGGVGIWHMRYAGGWLGWEYIGGNTTDNVAAVSRAPGQLDLYVRDQGGAVFTKALNSAGVWWPAGTDWAWLGGDFLGTPSVVSTASNRLDVFARGSENSIRLRSWNGSTW